MIGLHSSKKFCCVEIFSIASSIAGQKLSVCLCVNQGVVLVQVQVLVLDLSGSVCLGHILDRTRSV